MIVEVISLQHNETFLKPFFDKHYSWVDKITIIDKPFPNGIDDYLRRQWNQEAYEKSTADWVLFIDADEFCFVDKNHLAKIPEDYTHTRCYLCHVYPHITEKPLDVNLPIKEQRRHGYLEALYAKPCIVRGKKNIQIGMGSHSIYGDQKEYKEGRVLGAHWKNADVQYALDTRIKGRRDRFSEVNKKYGYGIQDMGITEQTIIDEFKAHENDKQLW